MPAKPKTPISLEQQVKRYRYIAFGALAALAISIVGIWVVGRQQLTKLNQAQTQLAQTTADQAANQTLSQFITQNQSGLEAIDRALPDQDLIVDYIATVEALQKSLNLPPSMTFSSIVPAKENNQLYIPFQIKLNTTLNTAFNFLRQFEKIPYLTKITAVSVRAPDGLGGVNEITIVGRVYVQDPFEPQN